VIIPLVTPRVYVPVDPAHPMPVPNPEQTASPLSLLLFSFLDPVIVLAYKLPHLPFDLLPPLADSDASENLKTRGFPVRLSTSFFPPFNSFVQLRLT
jgi:hypothetical protein